MNVDAFLQEQKSLLIAPAGHGKTHAIIECLHHTTGKQLILTHTHAGIASLKEKIKALGIETQKYHIETISGFVQKYVHAYVNKNEIPPQEDNKRYYTFLVTKGREIITLPVIQNVITTSYSGIFVDEYQDCTLQQHALIMCLSNNLPIRIFGDPLQGIFEFSDPLVNFDNKEHLGDFSHNTHTLETPWRWNKSNIQLGRALQDIRRRIELKQQINLTDYKDIIEFIKVKNENDIYQPNEFYYKEVNRRLDLKNLLIIHPISSSIEQRKNVVSKFRKPIRVLESIDDRLFYKLAKMFDCLTAENSYQIIFEVCTELFSKTELKKWLTEKSVVRKRNGDTSSQEISSKLNTLFSALNNSLAKHICSEILNCIKEIPNIRCYRIEVFYSLCSALEGSSSRVSVYDSMVMVRNNIRKMGRKISGCCIGTTLLTKGLEFEHVMILNVNKFNSPKHLYVALTRASKKLVVFGESPFINLSY